MPDVLGVVVVWQRRGDAGNLNSLIDDWSHPPSVFVPYKQHC